MLADTLLKDKSQLHGYYSLPVPALDLLERHKLPTSHLWLMFGERHIRDQGKQPTPTYLSNVTGISTKQIRRLQRAEFVPELRLQLDHLITLAREKRCEYRWLIKPVLLKHLTISEQIVFAHYIYGTYRGKLPCGDSQASIAETYSLCKRSVGLAVKALCRKDLIEVAPAGRGNEIKLTQVACIHMARNCFDGTCKRLHPAA